MVDAAAYDATADTTAETFEGYTFHVTQNIDFAGVASESNPMHPLNLDNGKYTDTTGAFQGNIQGHNHAFMNIYVTDTTTSLRSGNRFIGLFGKLGDGAVIENFGVDSGRIVMNTACARATAGTFGHAVPSALTATAPVLHNVWSGATIEVSGGTTNNNVAGMLAYSAGGKGEATVNGAYFFGSLSAETGTFGITHTLKTGGVYNALSNPATATYALSLQSSSFSVVSNVYSVGTAPISGTGDTTKVINNSNDNNAATAVEAAWAINKVQLVKAHTYNSTSKKYVESGDSMAPVYFTWTKIPSTRKSSARPEKQTEPTELSR